MTLGSFQGDLLRWSKWIEGGGTEWPLWLRIPLCWMFTMPFVLLPSILLVMLYRNKSSHLGSHAEPAAAPNGGPAEPPLNSGVRRGPPSVS
jgi:hypothetical protein